MRARARENIFRCAARADARVVVCSTTHRRSHFLGPDRDCKRTIGRASRTLHGAFFSPSGALRGAPCAPRFRPARAPVLDARDARSEPADALRRTRAWRQSERARGFGAARWRRAASARASLAAPQTASANRSSEKKYAGESMHCTYWRMNSMDARKARAASRRAACTRRAGRCARSLYRHRRRHFRARTVARFSVQRGLLRVVRGAIFPARAASENARARHVGATLRRSEKKRDEVRRATCAAKRKTRRGARRKHENQNALCALGAFGAKKSKRISARQLRTDKVFVYFT